MKFVVQNTLVICDAPQSISVCCFLHRNVFEFICSVVVLFDDFPGIASNELHSCCSRLRRLYKNTRNLAARAIRLSLERFGAAESPNRGQPGLLTSARLRNGNRTGLSFSGRPDVLKITPTEKIDSKTENISPSDSSLT